MGYFLWLRADGLNDNSEQSAIPGFRADLLAHAGRVVHTWTPTWHGFALTSSANYLIDYAKVKIGTTRDEDADLSAFNLEPIIITFKTGNWRFLTGSNVWYPVGHYDPSQPANAVAHTHYASFTQEFAATWRPRPWLELDSENYIVFNFRNRRTGYRSGNLFANELGVTAWPFAGLPQLGLGVGAYYLHQFEDDHLDGATVSGNKLTQIAVGPQAIYSFGPQTFLILKWQHIARADNAATGDLVWAQWVIPIGSGDAGHR